MSNVINYLQTQERSSESQELLKLRELHLTKVRQLISEPIINSLNHSECYSILMSLPEIHQLQEYFKL